MAKQDLAIVYMVGGLSSRFGGKIKQFAKVGPNGETLIEYSINQAKQAGFNKIIFTVGEKTSAPFREMFSNSYQGMKVLYAEQNFSQESRDKPWGSTDALCSARQVIDCPFVVCNGDDIYGARTFKILAEHLKKQENKQEKINATAGYILERVIPEQGKTNRGIFQVDNKNFVKEIKEVFNIEKTKLREINLSPESLTSMNVFALYPEVVAELDKILSEFKQKNSEDRRIECLLPVELSSLIKQGKIKMKIYESPDKWFGVTNPEDEEIVREQLIHNI